MNWDTSETKLKWVKTSTEVCSCVENTKEGEIDLPREMGLEGIWGKAKQGHDSWTIPWGTCGILPGEKLGGDKKRQFMMLLLPVIPTFRWTVLSAFSGLYQSNIFSLGCSPDTTLHFQVWLSLSKVTIPPQFRGLTAPHTNTKTGRCLPCLKDTPSQTISQSLLRCPQNLPLPGGLITGRAEEKPMS